MKTTIPLTWTPMVMVPGRYRLEPFSGTEIGEPEFNPICNKAIDYDTVIVHLVPDYYPEWRKAEPDKFLVGMTVWETAQLPPKWPPFLDQVDLVLVPSRWNQETFRSAGITAPIATLPHIHQTPAGKPCVKFLSGIPDSDFVFYTIGSWSERKAIYKILECYWNTFTKRDPVWLVMKTSRLDERKIGYGRHSRYIGRHWYTTRRALRKLRKRYPTPACVRLVAGEVPEHQIQGLHARGDCFVSLTRSEGWGLGAFEAAFNGNPVCITGYGGQLDFLPPDKAELINYRLINAEVTGTEREIFPPYHRWADADMVHASSILQKIFQDQDSALEKGILLKEHVTRSFAEHETLVKLLATISTFKN